MQPNKCFSCEKEIQEDTILRGRYVCANQRCQRFGLVSVVYLAPPETTPTPMPATPNPESNTKEVTPKDIPSVE